MTPIAENVVIDVTMAAAAVLRSGIAGRSTSPQDLLPPRRRAPRLRPVAMASIFSRSRMAIVQRPGDVVSIAARAVRAAIFTANVTRAVGSNLNAGLTSARILSPLAIPKTPVSQRW